MAAETSSDVPMADSPKPVPPRRVIPRERLEMAEALYLEGVPDHRLRGRLCAEFKVSQKTARRYVDRVRAKFALHPAPTPEAIRARSEAMLLRAYETAEGKVGPTGMANPDTGAMVAAAWRLAELHGATAPKRLDLTSKGAHVGAALPDAELLARIAELERAGG